MLWGDEVGGGTTVSVRTGCFKRNEQMKVGMSKDELHDLAHDSLLELLFFSLFFSLCLFRESFGRSLHHFHMACRCTRIPNTETTI